MRIAELDRLASKFVVNKKTKCWEWQTTKIERSITYGQFYFRGKSCLAHRASYIIFKGKIPKGLTIDHICRNGICVNPDHLRLLSLRDNILAGTGPSAVNAKKTHCIRGHKFTKANTDIVKCVGHRQCKTCKAYWQKNNREKRLTSYKKYHLKKRELAKVRGE